MNINGNNTLHSKEENTSCLLMKLIFAQTMGGHSHNWNDADRLDFVVDVRFLLTDLVSFEVYTERNEQERTENGKHDRIPLML